MIFFSIGVPGRFSEWCDAIIVRLIENAFGPVELAWAQSPADVALDLIRLAATHLVIASRHPREDLRALAAEAGRRVIVALGDPRAALRDLTAVHGGDFRAATAEAGRCCAAACICAGLPEAFVVRAGPREDAGAGIVAALGDAVGTSLDPARVAELLAAHPYPYPPDCCRELDAWWEGLEPAQRMLGGGALDAYIGNFRDGGFGHIVWDRTLFWRNGQAHLPADEAIEIGAAGQVLVGGPDVPLPTGQWQATVMLGVSKEAAGVGFDVAIVGMEPHEIMAQGRIVPDFRGVGTTTLAFVIGTPYGRSIGVNIASAAAAPGGRVALGNLTLSPHTGEGADIPSELTLVLGL